MDRWRSQRSCPPQHGKRAMQAWSALRKARIGGAVSFSVAALICAGLAIVSYRYVLGIGDVPPPIAANLFKDPWLAIHAATAATALLVGPPQFIAALRTRRPSVHRIIGHVYVLGCL